MIQSLFYFLSFAAIFFAVLVVTTRNPIHSVLYLVMTFFCIAGHYLLLNEQFLAVSHIIVYAGAIMVLFLFVIMLMNLNADSENTKSNRMKFIATISGGMFLLALVALLKSNNEINPMNPGNEQIGNINILGLVLYTDYILPFEVASVLFLVGMIGAVILGKKEIKTLSK